MNHLIFTLLAFLCMSQKISSAWSLFLGMLFSFFFKVPWKIDAKKILALSIVGLGFGISFPSAISSGSKGVVVTFCSLLLAFVVGYSLQIILKLEDKLAELLTVGTAICGGSAIAAVSSVLRPKDETISVALACIFILNALALILFPFLGHYFHLSINQFAVWAAIAIHDTSSVIGAASSWGDECIKIATNLKLTRTLWIIPTVLIYNVISKDRGKVKFPYFILGYLLTSLIASYIITDNRFIHDIFKFSKSLLSLALFLIGTSLSLKQLRECGMKTLSFAILLWITVSVSSLLYVLNYVV